jgi:hypothetical protein
MPFPAGKYGGKDMLEKILDISISNEFATGPDVAVVQICDGLAARIIKLAEAVKQLGVYKVSLFDYTPDYFVRDYESEDENAYKEPEDPNSCRVECVTLNVTDSDFFWSGILKHTDTRFETASVPLAELMSGSSTDQAGCGKEGS